MIPITKQEAQYMRQEGYGEFVKHTFSRHKHYYLVEHTEDWYKWIGHKKTLVRLSAMRKLDEYRKSRTACEVDEKS